MKTTKASIINMVSQLASIIELRKAQEKAEKEIKTALKDFMGNEAVLDAGYFCVVIESRSRTDLDRKALTIELGTEFLEKFTKSTTYEILTVKPNWRS